MVSKQSVEDQLKRVGFNHHGWGRGEARELHNILLPDEKIYDAVNGIYEGGFALLVATDVRVLLVDKKPMNYLTVEDLRFDMINELDYSHRLIGAQINIATGSKNLKFQSFNQPRLRKVIGHVQHCMADSKKKESSHQEDQRSHLEQINQQLQTYLLAQHQQQEQMRQQLSGSGQSESDSQPAALQMPDPINMSPELSDYLYAQRLLEQYRQQNGQANAPTADSAQAPVAEPKAASAKAATPQKAEESSSDPQMSELYAEGMREVFGKRQTQTADIESTDEAPNAAQAPAAPAPDASRSGFKQLDMNPLKIANAKLPLALRNRKFGRPSFHAHSQQEQPAPEPQVAESAGAVAAESTV